MSTNDLVAIRPKEDLILDLNAKIHVSGKMVQYLLSHQINGIRFLYKHFKNKKSCILNDEAAMGKCFQCVAFVGAVCHGTNQKHFLIICQNKEKLQHWNYHCSILMEQVNVKVADDEIGGYVVSSEQNSTFPCITLASIEFILKNVEKFTATQYDCLILHDNDLQIRPNSLKLLRTITAAMKIILCSEDLMTNLTYFYEVLKFSELNGPLIASNSSKKILGCNEFKAKFGNLSDKGASKRNLFFRQRNLLNICNEFYLRRYRNQIGKKFPLIDSKVFQACFDRWKASLCETLPIELNSSSCSEIFEFSSSFDSNDSGGNMDCNKGQIESSKLNMACTGVEDFDTQMSPLIYSDSESEEIENREIIDLNVAHSSPDYSGSQRQSPEIACNQEHASKVQTARIDKALESRARLTRQMTREKTSTRKCAHSRRLKNYKQLSIKIRTGRSRACTSTSSTRAENQTTVSNSKEKESALKNVKNSSRRISSTSDVQIVSQNLSPPIFVSSSFDSNTNRPEENETETQFNAEMLRLSPDLFCSFDEYTKDQETSIAAAHSDNEIVPETPETPETCSSNLRTNFYRKTRERDDIHMFSNTKTDIFEITKNDVFHNVLRIQSCDDSVSPVERVNNTTPTKQSPNPSQSCFSGLRLVIPKLNMTEVQKMQNELSVKTTNAMPTSAAGKTIDLTSSERTSDISSDEVEITIDLEKTPKHKRLLTPSTRACLKRQSNNGIEVDEGESSKTPSRSGWLSTRSADLRTETPRSRRRIDKWLSRTDENNAKATNSPNISRPRNLFKEFKCNTVQRLRSKSNGKTTVNESPSIFSDDD